MAFGFNLLFVFVLLPTIFIVFAVMLYYGKWKLVVGIVSSFIAISVLLYGLSSYLFYLGRPTKLTHDDIVGKYEIDTLLYPGKGSQWQYKTYSFEITDKDSLVLHINSADKQHKVMKAKFDEIGVRLDTSQLPADTNTYHLLRKQPLLVRGHKKYYYVFSSNYGNMFFRKRAKQ